MNNHVEFISYDGEWPNLCSGKLILKIDGVKCEFHYKFYNDSDRKNNRYPSFWHSGGGLTPDYSGGGLTPDYYTYEGEWCVNPEDLPQKFRPYAEEIKEVLNHNIPHGCCGGCA